MSADNSSVAGPSSMNTPASSCSCSAIVFNQAASVVVLVCYAHICVYESGEEKC